ncbi:hypothetical protein NN561_016492 [Cricetulus griseus]
MLRLRCTVTPASRTLRSPAPLFPPRPGLGDTLQTARPCGDSRLLARPGAQTFPATIAPASPGGLRKSSGPSRSPPARNLSSRGSGKRREAAALDPNPALALGPALSPSGRWPAAAKWRDDQGKGESCNPQVSESGAGKQPRVPFAASRGWRLVCKVGEASAGMKPLCPPPTLSAPETPARIPGTLRCRPGRFSDPFTGNPRKEPRRGSAA